VRHAKYSQLFQKKLIKIKGKELANILSKKDEILRTNDLDHYKNLKYDLKQYKRIHVNNSYVILFFGEKNTVYFVDYEHHDKIYAFNKKQLNKYKQLRF